MIYLVAIIVIICFVGFFPLAAANIASVIFVGGGAAASRAPLILGVFALTTLGFVLIKLFVSFSPKKEFDSSNHNPEGKVSPVEMHVFNANLKSHDRPEAPQGAEIEQGEFWNSYSQSYELQFFYRDTRGNRVLVKPKA